MLVPLPSPHIGTLMRFLLQVLLPRFDVVLSYDIGNGIRVEKGGEIFSRWPQLKQDANLPKAPRAAIESLTHYFRYAANLAQWDRSASRWDASLRTPAFSLPRYRVAWIMT